MQGAVGRRPGEQRHARDGAAHETSLGYEFVPYCITHQVRKGRKIHFVHDIAAVGLDGFDAEVQKPCDVLIIVTFRKQLDDLALPG